MQHYIRICKHCHREYLYCTYGNGPEYGTEAGCSMDYCAECQTAIDNALDKIPIRYSAQYMEIDEPRLLPVLEKIREKVLDKRKPKNSDIQWPTITCWSSDDGYDNVEEYTHMGKSYRVEWNDDTPDEKHIFVQMMYNHDTKEYEKPWRSEENGTYRKFRSFHRDMRRSFERMMDKQGEIKPVQIPEPMGKLFYLDAPFEWDLKLNEEEYKPKPKEHFLRTYTLENQGYYIKAMVKDGRGSCFGTKVASDINVSKLIDFVDYKYTCQKYDDEDTQVIIKIECA